MLPPFSNRRVLRFFRLASKEYVCNEKVRNEFHFRKGIPALDKYQSHQVLIMVGLYQVLEESLNICSVKDFIFIMDFYSWKINIRLDQAS